VLDKFALLQMLDVHFPTSDGRLLVLSRYTQPEADQKILLQEMILDMDGVIVDSEPIHGESFKLFLEKLKVPYTEQFINDLVGHSVNHNIRTINETYLQERPLNIEEGVKIRDAIYLDLITSRPLKPLKGIEDLILICQQKRHLSSASQEQ